MSALATATEIAPGWYPDPLGTTSHRWWDGTTWTAQTHDAVPTRASVDALPSRRQIHARLDSAPSSAEPDASWSDPPTEPPASTTWMPVIAPEPARVSSRAVFDARSRAAEPVTLLTPRPAHNPAANRALATALIGAVVTVVLLVMHIGLQFRGISGLIGVGLAIHAMVIAYRAGTGWVRAITAFVISIVITVIGAASLLAFLASGSVLASGGTFSHVVADTMRTTDHATSVVCPATASATPDTTFTCVETMQDGSSVNAVVKVASPTAVTWQRLESTSS
jgi:hypothetical protein